MTQSNKIPKIIHQTYHSRDLPKELSESVTQTKKMNPDWEYRFYDDVDIVRFLTDNFDVSVLDRYLSINPGYGAARADFFKYMLMFQVGGVYLDIKSFCTAPLDDVIKSDDEFVLANWRNGKGQAHESYGMHKALSSIPAGEFQQWHIICRPRHPFLRKVITDVSKNIDKYGPWRDGIGKAGVVRLTGPVAFTLAIDPIRHLHPHRLVGSEADLGLRYNASTKAKDAHSAHYHLFKDHYTTRLDGIVRGSGIHIINERIHRLYATARQVAILSIWHPWKRRRKAMRKASQ